jgi:hypothetical protein
MTFELPDMTAIVIVFSVAVALTVLVMAGTLTAFFAGNRKVRVARREPFLAYYGHLVTGH